VATTLQSGFDMAEPLDLHCATACDFAASIVLLLTSDPMETPCFATSEGNPIATAPAATQESTWAKINVNIIAPRIILYCIYPPSLGRLSWRPLAAVLVSPLLTALQDPIPFVRQTF